VLIILPYYLLQTCYTVCVCVCVCVCVTPHYRNYAGEEGRKYFPRGPHVGHPCPTVQHTTPHYPAYYSHSQQSLSHQIQLASWGRKVHWRVHKSPMLVFIHNEINPIHAILPHLRSVVILFYPLKYGFASGLFPSAVDSAALGC
jgi:hypothetical protein